MSIAGNQPSLSFPPNKPDGTTSPRKNIRYTEDDYSGQSMGGRNPGHGDERVFNKFSSGRRSERSERRDFRVAG